MMLVRRIVLLLALGMACLSGRIANAQPPAALSEFEPDDSIPTELILPEDRPFITDGEFIDMDSSLGCCDDGACAECRGPANPIFAWLKGVCVRGWIEQGVTFNSDSPTNRFNTPVTFNDRSNEYELNQLYMILEHPVDTHSGTVNLGGRADFLWGTDYFFTESFGLEKRLDGTQRWNSNNGPRGAGAGMYGLAMPQLYAEAFLPIWQGMKIKLGHFYTIMGYESVMAPENFFYSHSYSMQYGEPFTHTGALATFQASRGMVLQAGFHRGWNAWEDNNDQLSFLGGFKLRSLDDRTTFAFTITNGHEDADADFSRTAISMVLRREIDACTSYVFQYDLGREEGASVGGDAQWYGLTHYLYYQMSPTTELGMRVEWFNDRDNARVLGIADGSASGEDYGEVTLGVNWHPCGNVLLRPELRWDVSNVRPPFGAGGMFDGFTSRNQFLAAVDMIWHF